MFQRSVFGAVMVAACAFTLSPALACKDHADASAGAHQQMAQATTGQHAPATTDKKTAPQDVVKIGTLEITGPWSRATPGGAKVGAGYMHITNTGTSPDWLTGGTSSASDRLEIHEMAMKDGVMTMRPLPNGIEIAPGQTVKLEPGGYHIMFMGLKTQLKEGESVKGTLVFKNAGTADVSYQVRSIAAGAHGKGHGSPKGH